MKLDLTSEGPCFVGTVLTRRGLKALGAVKSPADLIEVRVDALRAEGVAATEIIAVLRHRRRPVLLTVRIPQEGGLYSWREGERASLALILLPHAEALDLELASAVALRKVVAEVRRRKKKLILSAHSLAKPVSPATLRTWRHGFARWKPDVRKIASRVNTPRDLQRLALILIEEPHEPWTVMGVGPSGELSRRVLTALGSRLVYGYLDSPAAPGQPALAALRRACGS